MTNKKTVNPYANGKVHVYRDYNKFKIFNSILFQVLGFYNIELIECDFFDPDQQTITPCFKSDNR